MHRGIAENGELSLYFPMPHGRDWVHSPVDPSGEAKEWARIHKTDSLVAVFGVGLGYQLKELAEQAPETILAYDPLGYRFGHPRVVVSSNWQEFRAHFPLGRIKEVGLKVTGLNAYKRHLPEEYRTWRAAIAQETQAIQSDIVTSHRFAWEWMGNTIRNWRHIPTSTPIARVFGQWKGKPAIILSAGPSAEAELEKIKKIQRRCLLITVGTMLPRLRAEGIEPDIVLSFDGGAPNYFGHFHGIKSDAVLVWDAIVHHLIPSKWQGPKSQMEMWAFRYVDELTGTPTGGVQVGPSVANTALDLALRMGADPVILVGQDCAYTGGATHTKGCHLHNFDYVPNAKVADIITVEGVDGPVQTSRTMQTFAFCFANIIARYPGQTVINTARGARLLGSVEKPLSEVLPAEDHSQDIARLRSLLTDAPPRDMTAFQNWLRTAIARCEHIVENVATIDLRKEFLTPRWAPLTFILHPIWSSTRCNDNWGREETRKAMRFIIPKMREVLL